MYRHQSETLGCAMSFPSTCLSRRQKQTCRCCTGYLARPARSRTSPASWRTAVCGATWCDHRRAGGVGRRHSGRVAITKILNHLGYLPGRYHDHLRRSGVFSIPADSNLSFSALFLIELIIYASRSHPSGVRSGSLADNRSSYLALVEKLQTYDDPLIISWTQKQTDLLNKEISEEDKRNRRINESFE